MLVVVASVTVIVVVPEPELGKKYQPVYSPPIELDLVLTDCPSR